MWRGMLCPETDCAVQETEVVAAGFPCVDVSRAGLRKGLEGKVCWRWLSSHRLGTGTAAGTLCMHAVVLLVPENTCPECLLSMLQDITFIEQKWSISLKQHIY